MEKSKVKSQKSKVQVEIKKLNTFYLLIFTFAFLVLSSYSFAQPLSEIEFNLDINSPAVPLPKIFKPNIDLSGRGSNRETNWPQELAAQEVLDIWGKEIGFNGLYRIQYNLWDINTFSKDKELQNKLLANYDTILKRITDSGGAIILDIFGTPAGLGRVLDKRSPPWDLKAFKELIKNVMRDLSCNKKYNIWYEVWNAPDLDDFFIGRKQEYLNMYKAVADAAKELEAETKIHIPVGGPSVSWWFQGVDGNNILTPERSLIYDLIKFCYRYRLPLDFISWHGFSTSAYAEKENTIYKAKAAALIRSWLAYFKFDKNTFLIIDEWNYDRQANTLEEREGKSYIAASYIPSRIKNMHEAGIDYQLYFCLEDFQDNKEKIVRNVGIFSFNPETSGYKGSSKASYNVFKMLSRLDKGMFEQKNKDDFTGGIFTKDKDSLVFLIYNYIDPDIAINFLSKNIASLKGAERKALLSVIKSDKLSKIIAGSLDIKTLKASKRVKNLLKEARDLSIRSKEHQSGSRAVKINLKGLKGVFKYERFSVSQACSKNCQFSPVEEKEIMAQGAYTQQLLLAPYAVELVVLKKTQPSISTTNAEKK